MQHTGAPVNVIHNLHVFDSPRPSHPSWHPPRARPPPQNPPRACRILSNPCLRHGLSFSSLIMIVHSQATSSHETNFKREV